MKKYLQLRYFARKTAREYRVNFWASIIIMVINDGMRIVLFILFLGFFDNLSLAITDFLLMYSFATLIYGIVHGVCNGIARLNEIIEQGQLDSILSRPVSIIPYILTQEINTANVGDIVFGIGCIIVYSVLTGGNILTIAKRFIVIIASILYVLGIFILLGTLSFRLQRGSTLAQTFLSAAQMIYVYPPTIFQRNMLTFGIVMIIGFAPTTFLPYYFMTGQLPIIYIIPYLLGGIGRYYLAHRRFHNGLRRYTSGNLVNTML